MFAFVIPKVKSHGFKSFYYNGCSLWNSLPHAFSIISNIPHFKVTFKATSVQQFLTVYSAMYQCFYQLWFICLHATRLITIF